MIVLLALGVSGCSEPLEPSWAQSVITAELFHNCRELQTRELAGQDARVMEAWGRRFFAGRWPDARVREATRPSPLSFSDGTYRMTAHHSRTTQDNEAFRLRFCPFVPSSVNVLEIRQGDHDEEAIVTFRVEYRPSSAFSSLMAAFPGAAARFFDVPPAVPEPTRHRVEFRLVLPEGETHRIWQYTSLTQWPPGEGLTN